MNARTKFICLILAAICSSTLLAEEVDVAKLTKVIRDIGAKAAGFREAIPAVRTLSGADVSQLPDILTGMDDAGSLATNWLRAAAETIAQRATDAGQDLPLKRLEQFLADTKHSPRGRRLAYELIRSVDASAEKRLIPDLLNDPSLELRRDAVAMLAAQADSAVGGDKMGAGSLYRKALTAARDLDQINDITKKLRDLGEKVDLPTHFGFVMKWNLIGPFDNRDKKGFDVAYGPEKSVDTSISYQGVEGKVEWETSTTKDEYGIVDLNEVMGKHKGAITYAHATFVADETRPIELRLGCINANKLWLNGKLLTANEVYHANTGIDQYTGKGQLKKGQNEILLKICQNEQEESWAQKWQFQLRVCDQYGTAVLSTNRPAASTVSVK